MIRLLEVELKKILKRKSIYIIWILMLIFCLLNNILFFTDYDDDGNYKYFDNDNLIEEQTKLENELTKYNKDNSNEKNMYITLKTKIEIIRLKQKYKVNSFQYNKINDYLYDIIYNLYYYKEIDENTESFKKEETKYREILINLDNNNYKYFLNKELEYLTLADDDLRRNYDKENDVLVKNELLLKIEENDFLIKILKIRDSLNIAEDNSYLNKALINYQENYKTIKYYNSLNRKLTYDEKKNYNNALANTKISKYIIENKQNINKQNNLNYQLRTILEDYEIFIIMLVLIVCSTIICDEFKDGTIKLLLIKPYSRGKILLSKYLTTIIILIISILLLIGMQFIIGGIIFGFNSLSIPVVVYNFSKQEIVEYHVFYYMLLRIIAKLPFLLILISISFFLSILLTSTIISITMPLMLYMFTPTMNYLTEEYNLRFMKYFININWNIEEYLFGALPSIEYISLEFSCLILLVYFTCLVILTFITFKKKNIKNI